MTSCDRNYDQRRFLIEASGRDSLGTSFQIFEGAQGWHPAAQVVSEMFKRVPNPADYKVYQLDLVDGHCKDVTEHMMIDAEKAFHQSELYHSARASSFRARRTVSTFGKVGA